MSVKRIYVEKRAGFDIAAQELQTDLQESFGLPNLEAVRLINRYDMEGLSDEEIDRAKQIVFAEPPVDVIYEDELPDLGTARMFAVEYLPGQYDQTADSAAQCVQLLTQKERPAMRTARLVALVGDITDEEFAKIKRYCINAVESREASFSKPATLKMDSELPPDVAELTGFIGLDAQGLQAFLADNGLAMSLADLAFCQDYFKNTEKRDPSITEIKVIDTYWSDHCRHTTFMTKIEDVEFEDEPFNAPVKAAYELYAANRRSVYGDQTRDMTLMDIAVIGMKYLRKLGKLEDLDVSEEINACSIVVDADIDGRMEKWLVMFKNETHNHPTEIEPFGGAATCLGGAIRDPLSGRSYVYQAMRVTGAADPTRRIDDTLPGKLPQKKITLGAARGYSSYGNQIGLATGQVTEVYHDNFVAKRMEIGAVIAAAPKVNVVRTAPQPGDVVILVGGRTGRDGCGGATGSSKEHTEESLFNCGAEVQKGNAPTERKIQRLFRDPRVSSMIKRCNDFGAGGVSVAIGELTDGLVVNLDAVPKKYEGLDGTELAISESQERMAVVVDKADEAAFIKYADAENLEATVVATVSEQPRLKMLWRGTEIVDLSREFLNTNGVKQLTGVYVAAPDARENVFTAALPSAQELGVMWRDNLRDLNVCSQKGLAERFDSTIGSGTVLMPFGGSLQRTPEEGMVAKLPLLTGQTTTATAMSFGFNPRIAAWSPFHGAVYALVEAVTKIVALGGDYSSIRLTLQEYFEKLGDDKVKWGKPFSALLGALYVQNELQIPAIGGKDSMSGTFKDINVPPSLVAFAVAVLNTKQVVSAAFKEAGDKVVVVPATRDAQELPDFTRLKDNFAKIRSLMAAGHVKAAASVRVGGIAATVSKMAFGNGVGCHIAAAHASGDLFAPQYGTLVLEVAENVDWQTALSGANAYELGVTSGDGVIRVGGSALELEDLYAAYAEPLEKIFATKTARDDREVKFQPYEGGNKITAKVSYAKPRIFIPVFPGTNCEYDSVRAFEEAGGSVETIVVRNLSPQAIEDSVRAIAAAIDKSQIVMLPGGFSAGDEPDGSGKFIAAMFRNSRIKEAVNDLLTRRDGLMLGICNGFQALIKLGLVPYGEIVDLTVDSPTLTYNKIGRHISCMVNTRVVSNLSPWFNNVNIGDVHSIAVSHGEGRFVANDKMLDKLLANGQIATQYVDASGVPALNIPYNPNGSLAAIEGITSPDGRVLGKMGHSERRGDDVCKNVPGCKDQQLFAAGIRYYK